MCGKSRDGMSANRLDQIVAACVAAFRRSVLCATRGEGLLRPAVDFR